MINFQVTPKDVTDVLDKEIVIASDSETKRSYTYNPWKQRYTVTIDGEHRRFASWEVSLVYYNEK